MIDASYKYESLFKSLVSMRKDKITESYLNFIEISDFSRFIDLKEIIDNDYNLSVKRYFVPKISVEEINITKLVQDYNHNFDTLIKVSSIFIKEINVETSELIETTFGSIPKDWKLQKLSSLCKII